MKTCRLIIIPVMALQAAFAAAAPLSQVTTPAPDKIKTEEPEGKSTDGFAWTVHKLGGRDYVSMGDVARFYQFPKQEAKDGDLWLRSPRLIMRCRKDSTELLVNNVRFKLKHPVVEHEDSYWISRYDLALSLHPILKPGHLKNAPKVSTVVIDAGDGGADKAAEAPGGDAEFTRDIAKRLKQKLEESGYRVVMTGAGDRVAVANAANIAGDAVLLSLRFEGRKAAETGVETYFGTAETTETNEPEAEREARMSVSAALAVAIHANTLYKLRCVDGAIQSAPPETFPGAHLPAVVIKGESPGAAAEGARIATPEYRDQFAAGIAGGVGNFVRALATSRPRARDSVPRRGAD